MNVFIIGVDFSCSLHCLLDFTESVYSVLMFYFCALNSDLKELNNLGEKWKVSGFFQLAG